MRVLSLSVALGAVLMLGSACQSAPAPAAAGSGSGAAPAAGSAPAAPTAGSAAPTSMPTAGSGSAAAEPHGEAGHEGHEGHEGHDHAAAPAAGSGTAADLLGPDGRPRALNPGETGHYGAPFTIEGDPVPLDVALTTCADTGQSCKVTGTIERVCQRAGCWFTLAAPNVPTEVRVQMLNYGFFVPRNTPGATVVLEGTLARTQIPQERAQHYADDEAALTGQPARVVEGPQDAYEFTIAAADVTLPAVPTP